METGVTPNPFGSTAFLAQVPWAVRGAAASHAMASVRRSLRSVHAISPGVGPKHSKPTHPDGQRIFAVAK